VETSKSQKLINNPGSEELFGTEQGCRSYYSDTKNEIRRAFEQLEITRFKESSTVYELSTWNINFLNREKQVFGVMKGGWFTKQ